MWVREDRVGTYIILEQPGASGMGVVFRARDTRLQREVALKGYNRRFTMAMFDPVALNACRSEEPLEHFSEFVRKPGVIPAGEPRVLKGAAS